MGNEELTLIRTRAREGTCSSCHCPFHETDFNQHFHLLRNVLGKWLQLELSAQGKE